MTLKDLQVSRDVSGYHQLTSAQLAAATTCPGTGSVVSLQAETQNVRYTLDGSTPTTTVGFILPAGQTHTLNVGAGNISTIKVIRATAGAILNIHTYK